MNTTRRVHIHGISTSQTLKLGALLATPISSEVTVDWPDDLDLPQVGEYIEARLQPNGPLPEMITGKVVTRSWSVPDQQTVILNVAVE